MAFGVIHLLEAGSWNLKCMQRLDNSRSVVTVVCICHSETEHCAMNDTSNLVLFLKAYILFLPDASSRIKVALVGDDLVVTPGPGRGKRSRDG